MNDTESLGTPDDPAAAVAAQRVLEAIRARWSCIDGPRASSLSWRWPGGSVRSQPYVSFSPMPREEGSMCLGHRRLEVLADWLPDIVEQYAAMCSEGRPPGSEAVNSSTHQIVWRCRPEFHREKDGRWFCYMRLALIPKGARLLESTEGEVTCAAGYA